MNIAVIITILFVFAQLKKMQRQTICLFKKENNISDFVPCRRLYRILFDGRNYGLVNILQGLFIIFNKYVY